MKDNDDSNEEQRQRQASQRLPYQETRKLDNTDDSNEEQRRQRRRGCFENEIMMKTTIGTIEPKKNQSTTKVCGNDDKSEEVTTTNAQLE